MCFRYKTKMEKNVKLKFAIFADLIYVPGGKTEEKNLKFLF